jgi:hypothetical protein
VPIDRDRYGHDAARHHIPELGLRAPVDGSGREMEYEIDDARRLVTAKQAAIEPLDLRSDAGEGRDRGEQWIENRRAHR